MDIRFFIHYITAPLSILCVPIQNRKWMSMACKDVIGYHKRLCLFLLVACSTCFVIVTAHQQGHRTVMRNAFTLCCHIPTTATENSIPGPSFIVSQLLGGVRSAFASNANGTTGRFIRLIKTARQWIGYFLRCCYKHPGNKWRKCQSHQLLTLSITLFIFRFFIFHVTIERELMDVKQFCYF